VNASTWGLLLTGKMIHLSSDSEIFKRLIARVGEPVIRLAVRQAMRIMGHQFVLGRTIDEALQHSQAQHNLSSLYSFDMLGEAALTAADAERYFLAYKNAIKAIGARGPYQNVFVAPSISIKLSALHPRYEMSKRLRVMNELAPRVLSLAQLAKSFGMGFTIDAEESERLGLSLELIENFFSDSSLDGWEGFGLAVQAYQKRAPYVLDFLVELAKKIGRRMPVRLVKGAYWESTNGRSFRVPRVYSKVEYRCELFSLRKKNVGVC
jgi:RHH-type transcriptional regulator, proline utilization regulon repressor / proline dehydrogenase / delta 1-pyrroline-5-carboxylate dehydrogenase